MNKFLPANKDAEDLTNLSIAQYKSAPHTQCISTYNLGWLTSFFVRFPISLMIFKHWETLLAVLHKKALGFVYTVDNKAWGSGKVLLWKSYFLKGFLSSHKTPFNTIFFQQSTAAAGQKAEKRMGTTSAEGARIFIGNLWIGIISFHGFMDFLMAS